MERELLFYSLAIYLIFRFGGIGGLSDGDGWKAVMPLSRARWWYPTAYAAFIVFEPLARRGLRSMGRREHALLAVTVAVVWGLFQGLNRANTFTRDPVVVFLAIYVVVCYLRWYRGNLSTKVAATMIALGYAMLIAQAVRGGVLAPGDMKRSTWLANAFQLPTMFISLGLVSLFARLDFVCPAINFVAKSTFAAYLISDYTVVRPLLWEGLFAFGDWITGPWAIPLSGGCVFAAFALCAAADLPRRALFHLTVDRAPGMLFDRAWSWAEPRILAVLGVD